MYYIKLRHLNRIERFLKVELTEDITKDHREKGQMKKNKNMAKHMQLVEELQRIENQKQIALKKQMNANKNREEEDKIWEIIRRNQKILSNTQAKNSLNEFFSKRNPLLSILNSTSKSVNNRSRPPSPGINRGRGTLKSMKANNGSGNINGSAKTNHARHNGNKSRRNVSNPLHGPFAPSRSPRGSRLSIVL